MSLAAFTTFVAHLIILTVSKLNCKYFEFLDGGLLIPIDICLDASFQMMEDYGSFKGSYKYTCDDDKVALNIYNHTGCDLYQLRYQSDLGQIAKIHCPISAGICNHLSFKLYAGYFHHKALEDCSVQNQEYYIEGAFVTGCWNDGSYSMKLECNGDKSFSFKVYTSNNCIDGGLEEHTIESGCDWFNDTQGLIPVIPEYFNLTYGSNHTYFDITTCGGGYDWYDMNHFVFLLIYNLFM